jgi:L-iditol 2-dehydrogenase
MNTMKAVVVRKPNDYSVATVPKPVAPEGGLLLKVEACGLCGSDLRMLRSGHDAITFPWIVGHEICGSVVDIGPSYTASWNIGDRLSVGPLAYCGVCDFCTSGRYELCENQREIGKHWPGGFAEYVAIPEPCVKLGNIQRVPESMESIHATIVEPVSSCVNGQEKAEVTIGDTVVIFGAGPIGCIHIALARARGAFRIYVIDVSQHRLDMVSVFQPDDSINATEIEPVDFVLKHTGGKGADVIIVATPAPTATIQALQMARKGGRILQFGGMAQQESKPSIDINLIHYRGLSLIGITTFGPKHNQIAMQLVQMGRIPAEKLITHTFPLQEFVQGSKIALEGKSLKTVFIP